LFAHIAATTIERAVAADGEDRHGEPVALQGGARLEHGLVLGGHRHDVVLPPAVDGAGSDERQRDRLRGAAGEAERLRVGADERADALARLLDGLVGGPAVGVVARRVAEPLREHGEHRLDGLRSDGRRGVVVEVDRDAHHGLVKLRL
jgi:hypothetical protein